ncbi:rhamnan synthesis F family protein [Brachyspira innocens]|uniref:rhamnan synthesis F family protein n=1 Tax=Brachyspira innocens TaxID=13264 RepID=UPI0003712D97|nr:rhamnan synthesis F family protein [Brachyspira innocens]
MKKRIAIFAGYDKDGIVDDYVVYYIKELKKIADIIYVSDCNMLDSELEKISDYCIHIINGRHEEYDFGSYKRGYLYAKENNILKNYDYLILCNDSCYGPFFNFQEIVENMEGKNTDVWGMFKFLKCEGYEEHLQSYFVSMKQKVFLSNWYEYFIRSIKKELSKIDIVKKYEIGMSVLFKEHGCSMSSFLDSSIKENENDWNDLVYTNVIKTIMYGFPFLKVGRMKYYSIDGYYIDYIKNIISYIKHSYDISLICNNLNRTVKIRYACIFKNNICFGNKIFNINAAYNNMRYKIVFTIFNKMKITIFLPKSLVYRKKKDFNFLLDL